MRRLMILLSLAAVALALAMALSALQPEGTPASLQPQPTQDPTAYRMLYQRQQSDFLCMKVTLASGESYSVTTSLVYDSAGNLLGVRNSLGQPVTVDGMEDFALDTTSFQMMLLTAMNLPVTASYPGLDPAACGLDSPSARIEITYASGQPIVLTLGHMTSTGVSCYVAMEGDENIHLVPADFHQVMTQPLNAHHRLPGAASYTASSAAQAAVVLPDSAPFIATKRAEEDAILPWKIDQPFIHSGSTERIEAFVEAVCAICADGYEATVYDAAGLAVYGLDNPTRLLVAFNDGSIRDIHLGGDAGSGMVYARMDSTGDVYRISRTRLQGLLNTDNLLDRFVALVSASSMQEVTVTTPEHVWTLHSQGEARYVNGQSISSQVFGTCYTAIVGLQFDQSTAAAATGDPLAHIAFQLQEGGASTVTFYPFDQHYVQAITNGGGSFLLRTERLESMLATLKEQLP